MQETDVAGGPGQRGQVASDPPLAPSAVTPPPWKLSSPDSEPALRTPQHRRIPCFLFNSPPPPGPSPGSRLPPLNSKVMPPKILSQKSYSSSRSTGLKRNHFTSERT